MIARGAVFDHRVHEDVPIVLFHPLFLPLVKSSHGPVDDGVDVGVDKLHGRVELTVVVEGSELAQPEAGGEARERILELPVKLPRRLCGVGLQDAHRFSKQQLGRHIKSLHSHQNRHTRTPS